MRNPDTILPVYHPPQRAYTIPPINSNPYDNRPIHPTISVVTTNGAIVKKTWFTYIVEYAHVIGLGIAAIGIVVAIVAVVVK
ncbi:hypothetical protein AA0114_g7480 [Alternaria tenuissima]|jgi:hypothetical protein|uniref:Uncharacterized protein n=1 Tax=Alternaria tenuissima TaxID=119927 RepID=A0A4Q4MBE6_9PLEO|nr:hypothetical protein AA0114_g7480 [Alternaria tenuissima]